MLSPKQILALALPSLCIFYSLTGAKGAHPALFREAFGNGDYYLELDFFTNPNSLRANRASFHGLWVTKFGEQKIQGVRERKGNEVIYQFEAEEGSFAGTLENEKSGCEPSLHFQS